MSTSESSCSNKTVIVLIALCQGLLALTDLAIFYMLKDDLDFSPSQVAFFTAIVMIPWIIKPLWGFISDSYPIYDKRRSPYLFIFGSAQCILWALLASTSHTVLKAFLLILGTSLATCFCNVIGEALVVEESQKSGHKQKKAANYVSLFFGARATGYLLTAFISGYLLGVTEKETLFYIAACFPGLIIIAAFLLQEEKVEIEIKVGEQVSLIGTFLKKREIWVPVLFIFLFSAVPGCGDAMFFFYVNELGFSPEFLGWIKFVYGIGAILGILCYNYWLKDVSFKKLLVYSTIVCSIINLSLLLLVTRINTDIGIPDVTFAICCSFIVQLTAELNIMPLLVLCCKICPKNIEGSLYAFLMSTWNLGSIVSGFLGGFLVIALGINQHNFDNLWLMIVITSILMVLPLPILHWVEDADSSKESNSEEKESYSEV